MKINRFLGYYFLTSYRRKLLDKLLKKHEHLYRGIVLDIGGRDRGIFKSPRERVENWIIADIEINRQPDILLDVSKMHNIKNESIDVINALELFEHVLKPEQGLSECYRVLKTGGTLIASMPFLFPIHADPHDYQRWTKEKWEYLLKTFQFKDFSIIPMGGYFTVFSEQIKFLNTSLGPMKFIGFLFYPVFDLITVLDNIPFIKNQPRFNTFTTGYMIVAHK